LSVQYSPTLAIYLPHLLALGDSFPHAYARNSTRIRHQSDHIIFSCSSPTDWEKGQGDLNGKKQKTRQINEKAKPHFGIHNAKAGSSAAGTTGT